jgi:uncharacterized protein YbjT (DUF2867 family)
MILVVGATGILGGMITQKLLAGGKVVRILVRHNSPSEQLALQGLATSAKSLINAGAKPVYADLKDRASLDQACEGISTIITTANSAMRGGEDNVDSVDRQGNRNLIATARVAGVEQFIFISFMNANLDHPVPLFQAKAEIEMELLNKIMPYTIIAPNYFMESWVGMVVGMPLQAHQPVTLVGRGQRLHSIISISDVASFVVASIGHSCAINQKLLLGGPDPVSWCDIIDTFSQELGQPVPVRFITPGQSIPGLPEIIPMTLTDMETYDSPVHMDGLAKNFGVQQTDLSTVVRRMLNYPVGQAGDSS